MFGRITENVCMHRSDGWPGKDNIAVFGVTAQQSVCSRQGNRGTAADCHQSGLGFAAAGKPWPTSRFVLCSFHYILALGNIHFLLERVFFNFLSRPKGVWAFEQQSAQAKDHHKRSQNEEAKNDQIGYADLLDDLLQGILRPGGDSYLHRPFNGFGGQPHLVFHIKLQRMFAALADLAQVPGQLIKGGSQVFFYQLIIHKEAHGRQVAGMAILKFHQILERQDGGSKLPGIIRF
ncbi:hypothetical protein SDC9_119641 [bioreactor metagenome]|uniref:Uncharacterized protein n=1 Tax=bioreactor metagenome TaxID=1076179 RepID=A0A645C535_9ZZZZ